MPEQSEGREERSKAAAVKAMVDVLDTDPTAVFVVGVDHYAVDGRRVFGAQLTMSAAHTPNIRFTDAGPECDGFVPDESSMVDNNDQVKRVHFSFDFESIRFICCAYRDGKHCQEFFYGDAGLFFPTSLF